MIKGLDDDEIEFLDLVDRTKLAAERKKNLDEERELNDYRNRVASLQEKSLDQRLQAEISAGKQKTATTPKHSQIKLLKGVVVKKPEPKKRKLSEEDGEESSGQKRVDSGKHSQGALQCIGILPGLGCYNDSTDSDVSSDSEEECSKVRIDMLGRKIKRKQEEDE